MERGYENGLVQGNTAGLSSGLHGGRFGHTMSKRLNMLNPSTIRDPKRNPVFYINAESTNVLLNSGSVQTCYNLVESVPNQILEKVEDVIRQNAGTTYRPPLVLNGLGGRNYMDFGDTANRYLESSTLAKMYCTINSPTNVYASGTGFTYMFVIRRANLPTSTVSILDGRDSTTLAGSGDILLELNSNNSITFDYKGGQGGSVTSITGTAGVGLLTDWSILTVKCQLRIDGGPLPLDNQFSNYRRYDMPRDNRVGSTSPIDIFVNGVEQQKTITTNNFTNSDHFGDGSYRMLDRNIFIGNKGAVFGTGGTHIAAALMIPAYVDKSFQQRIENYFRYYYNKPF
jgi:hypothetical protein